MAVQMDKRSTITKSLVCIILCMRFFYHSTFYHSALMSWGDEKKTSNYHGPGFAACLIVLDDTIRLYEWIAYHYTVVPLTSLVITLDPLTSNSSMEELNSMVRRWENFGLNISIWHTFPKVYNYSVWPKTSDEHGTRQRAMMSSCIHHFLDQAQEKFLLFTDTDEFLSFNFVLPEEDLIHFDSDSIFSPGAKNVPTMGKRARDRLEAWPIRKMAGMNPNQTILSFIESQQEAAQTYFPAESGCTRIVGLTYGTNTTDDLTDESLMTRKYQQHQKYTKDGFSKVMIELPKISKSREELNHIATIHNPFPMLCGKNGKHSSGQDFSGSVLKVAHYVGSIEGWLERGGGKGSHLYTQDRKSWEEKNRKSAPYTEVHDAKMGAWVDWVEFFIAKVGIKSADELYSGLFVKGLRSFV